MPNSYTPDEWTEMCGRFAAPGGSSALHRATKRNPRKHQCPTCGRPNMLTPKDVAAGYQCDYCADAAEGGY